jgi:dTDP-4-dehydrorhamnose 3,5-epimerase
VEIRESTVPGAFVFRPVQHADDRGVFLEAFRADHFEAATGRRFDLRQTNVSVSARGVARGIHFADVPQGQAKYVTVVLGSIVDYVIDIRTGSPTFGQWEAIPLDDRDRAAVFLPEGFGHLFVATSETATVNYLTNDVYRPGAEHGITPLDARLALDLPFPHDELLLSPKDVEAPSLAEAESGGLLPSYDACLEAYAAARVLSPQVDGSTIE